ncbi:MAG: PrsW family glutamic-type intramembrane protease [Blastocatellia bacterium]
MRYILIPFLSLLPCVLWLWYFYTRSIYRREPLRVVALTFLLGALSTLLAMPVNLAGQSLVLDLTGVSDLSRLLVIYLVIAPVEELCKLSAVLVYAWRHHEFDEPLDGVIYSATAALGFAAAENLIYFSESDPALVLLRGPLTNPGHALFSALWGLGLSRARMAANLPGRRLRMIVQGWLIAAALHGTFDLLLQLADHIGPIFYPVILGAIIGLFLWVRQHIHFHRDRSPHREGTLLMQLDSPCPDCGKPGLAGTNCVKCGAAIPPSETAQASASTASAPTYTSAPGGPSQLISRSASGAESIAWLLNTREMFIGRTLNNDLVIDDPSVSRRHARIAAVNGGFRVYDLDSSNGTFLNGKRVTEAPIPDGGEIKFGNVVYLFRAARG